MDTTKAKDFVEISYTGYSQGTMFDSNREADIKAINSKAKAKKNVIVIGEGMVVPGLDKALEGKEVGKEFEVTLSPKEGFGERNRNLMKTIPLKVFTDQRINPYPGAVLDMDGAIAKIISVSGARVMTDFNNPLAGKELVYKCTIVKIVTDDKEKATALFENMFRFVPEFDVNATTLTIKGPKPLEQFANAFKDKIKALLNKDLAFEEKKIEKNEDKIVKSPAKAE
jgi:FKBP-type peptidyl-prolyl cis-trans isomerase 2